MPYNGSIVFEPFVGKIFDNIALFLEKLQTTSFIDNDLKILKIEVGNRIKDFLVNESQPFIIKDKNHKKAIESVMRKNGIKIENIQNDFT